MDSASSSVVGRVEVCFNHSYGTICGVGWSNAEASVVCKQLGFSSSGEKFFIHSQVEYSL